MSENKEIQESSTDVQKNNPTDQEKKNVLFGTIAYNDDSTYESFLQTMNLSQALFVLIASANFAQVKGSFNILESETLATAIRVIRKNSANEKSGEASSADTNTEA